MRQYAAPLIVSADGGHVERPEALSLGLAAGGISEDAIQALIHAHPSLLPIGEIDAAFANPVPICRELNTPAGPIDNLMVTPSGMPVLVECKLWRNPQARREVIGQILDYAKELGRWSVTDLEREARKRLDTNATLAQLVAQAGHAVDEADFNDAVTRNLRRGRILLLVVGDGIREGVEAIVEYVQAHAGLHFSLGLVELPIFRTTAGQLLVVPRVLTRTQIVTRTVIATPVGMTVQGDEDEGADAETIGDKGPLSRIGFWRDFIEGLQLDDAEQPKPKPGHRGDLSFMLPVPDRTSWLTVYREIAHWRVGVFLSSSKDSFGARFVERMIEDWPAVTKELGGAAEHYSNKAGQPRIGDSFATGPWTEEANRQEALAWLRARTNDFINVFRPRVRSVIADIEETS